MFLSKDDQELVEEKKDYEQKINAYKELFFDGEECPRVVLGSLMRSGNSLFRRLLEQTSGIVTGTTMNGVLSA